MPHPPAAQSNASKVAEAAGVIARVRPGDLWQLGNHRLLCDDSRDPAQVARLMAGETATLTITSPPYNLGHNALLAGSKLLGASKYRHGADALPPAEYLDLLCRVTENALAVSSIAVLNVQMLAGNKVALVEFLHRFRHEIVDIAIWDKGNGTPAMARNVLNARFEFLVFLTRHRSKGKTSRTLFTADFRGTVANVYSGPPQRRNDFPHLHGATFPLHLPLWLIQTFDGKADSIRLVFDPFLGTGTTLLAAEQLGRRCLGIEIEPAYCDVVLARWEACGSKPARLAAPRCAAAERDRPEQTP